MTREQIIEAMARAACQNMLERHGACYDTCEITGKCCGEDIDLPGTSAALTALEAAIPGLADVISGKAVFRPAVSRLQGNIKLVEAFPAGMPALIVSLIVETEEHINELPPQFQARARAMIEAGKAGT